MSTYRRQSGLTVTVSTHYQLAGEAAAASPRQRGRLARPSGPIPLPPPPAGDAAGDDPLVAAFKGTGMEVLDTFELEPSPAAARTRGTGGAGGAAGKASLELTAKVPALEDAVLLLEQEGFYSWKFAESVEPLPATQRRGVAPAGRAQKRVVFSVEIEPSEGPARGDVRRGVVSDFVFGRVKAVVLKFAARIAVGQGVKYLERGVTTGLRLMNTPDPQGWKLVEDISGAGLPSDRPARILLFIHGTFSSTVGAFGALAGTPWGGKFLEAARQNYDLVLGFDHATLSADPLANATELLTLLQGLNLPLTPHFDVVTHSRGGLVFRSLSEHLLPISQWKARFDRVVFVAVTNGGTRLAEPENWKTLIDLYTNISVAAFKLLGMIPQAKAVTTVLSELVQGLGAFIQYCATHAVEEGGVPGLAAMHPDGDFIRALNGEQPGQPTVDTSYYCAVTSEFSPRVFGGEHEPKEMSHRFVQWLSGALTRQLMQEANDLVVNTPSMKAIDLASGRFVKDSLDFGANPQVYHTNYFVRPEVVGALTRWLRLVEPEPATVTRPAPSKGNVGTAAGSGSATKGRVSRGKPRGTLGGGANKGSVLKTTKEVAEKAAPEVNAGLFGATHTRLRVGGTAVSDLPFAVDTNIVVASEDTPLSKCVETIQKKAPSYVVMLREDAGRTLNYALRPEEVLTYAENRPGEVSLLHALQLHESDASHVRTIYDAVEIAAPDPGRRETTARGVVVVQGKPVGVIPEERELPSADDLAAIASKVLSPTQSEAEQIQLRRSMPDFAPAPAATPARRGRGAKATQTATCHFHAEMQEEVVVGRKTSVDVIVSRELIGLPTGVAAQAGAADVQLDRKLIVQVIPRVNFEPDGESRVEVDPPSPDDPLHLVFDLRATDPGEGEVWVSVIQRQVTLVTLILKPRVVSLGGGRKRVVSASAETPEAPKLAEPLHQLRIYERELGGKIFYEFELHSPALNNTHTPLLRSEFLKTDRTAYVEKLYKEIEGYWLSNKDDAEAFAAELRAAGGQLLSHLVPEKIQEILWTHRDQISNIMVLSTEPFIPWELVYLKDPAGKSVSKNSGKFLGEMGLIRWLQGEGWKYNVGWPPDTLKIRKGRAHYVIPQYPHPDYVLPELEEEAAFLKKEFGAAAVTPQPNPVRELISEPDQFDLLHFACHGFAEMDNISNAQLMLEGRVEGGNYIPAYLSAKIVEEYSDLQAPDNRPLVVLNSCQTGGAGYNLTGLGGFAQAFLRGGAGAFVGALWAVGDRPARVFTETLYTSLRSGKNLSQATVEARKKTRESEEATWLAYAVYGHPHLRLVTK